MTCNLDGETDRILTGDIGSEGFEFVYSSRDMDIFLLEFEVRLISLGGRT